MPTTGPGLFQAQTDERCSFFVLTDTFATSRYLVAARAAYEAECRTDQDVPTGISVGETHVYDLETGEVINTLRGTVVAVSHDERWVAFQEEGDLVELTNGAGQPGIYVPAERFVVADLLTGETVTELEGMCRWLGHEDLFASFHGFSGPPIADECAEFPGSWLEFATVGAFSPDGATFALAGRSGRFTVWDTTSGEILWSIPEPGEETQRFGGETHIEYSPDGKHLVVADWSTVRVYEIGKWDFSKDDHIEEFFTQKGGPFEMEFTPDGELLVLSNWDVDLEVVATQNWHQLAVLEGQQGGYFPNLGKIVNQHYETRGLNVVDYRVHQGERIRGLGPGAP